MGSTSADQREDPSLSFRRSLPWSDRVVGSSVGARARRPVGPTARRRTESAPGAVNGGPTGPTKPAPAYSPLDQINRDTVKNLQVAWTWKFDNFGTGAEASPPRRRRSWSTASSTSPPASAAASSPPTPAPARRCGRGGPTKARGSTRAPRKVHRGVAYWTDGKRRAHRRRDARLPAGVAQRQDRRCRSPGFGAERHRRSVQAARQRQRLDPIGRIGNSSPPVISNDVIVVGPALTPGGRVNKANVKGDVMAFDVRTGKKLWTFHTIPRKGEPGYETWLGGSARVHRQRRRLGTVLRRPAARLRLSAHRVGDQRRLRRPSSRRTTSTRIRSSASTSRPAR